MSADASDSRDDDAGSDPRLERLRERIIRLDDDIIKLIGERRDLVVEIGRIKEELGLAVLDPAREARVVRRVAERSRELGVDVELTRDVIWRIIASAREAQSRRSAWGPPDPPPEEGAPPK